MFPLIPLDQPHHYHWRSTRITDPGVWGCWTQ